MYLSSRASIFNVVRGERNLPIRMTGGFPFAGKSRLPSHSQLSRTESSGDMGGRVRRKGTEVSWRLVVLDVLWFSLRREEGKRENVGGKREERREGKEGGKREERRESTGKNAFHQALSLKRYSSYWLLQILMSGLDHICSFIGNESPMLFDTILYPLPSRLFWYLEYTQKTNQTATNSTCNTLQATPFAWERKGLVMLQPSCCPHSRNLKWPIRSVLFVDCIRSHGVQLRHKVFSGCQHLITELLCSIIAFLSDNSVVAAWPDPSSLMRRVWLARLL